MLQICGYTNEIKPQAIITNDRATPQSVLAPSKREAIAALQLLRDHFDPEWADTARAVDTLMRFIATR